MTKCNVVYIYQCIRRLCCFHLQGLPTELKIVFFYFKGGSSTFLLNNVKCLWDYTMLHARRLWSWSHKENRYGKGAFMITILKAFPQNSLHWFEEHLTLLQLREPVISQDSNRVSSDKKSQMFENYNLLSSTSLHCH